MTLLLIDNYDSFTYNLLHYFGELGADVQVVRNDKLAVEDIAGMKHIKGIVISPGPCTPNEAGICLDVVKEYTGKLPILGVCLGHQAIGQAHGCKVIRAPYPMHGKTSNVSHQGKGVFNRLENPFVATRYHSLIIDRDSLVPELEITAESDDGLIMGIQHKEHPVFGIQFHPESIASEHGHDILRNFLKAIK